MNPRERYTETLTFGTPDKVPFHPGGPRESTRARWHTEGLPEDGHWFDHLCETIGVEPDPAQAERASLGVDTLMIPQFEEKVIERKADSQVVQDWKGNICEISNDYDVTYLRFAKDFVTRRWIKCPVENRDDWEAMKERYDPDAPGRFPDDFDRRCEILQNRDYLCRLGWSGPFWQLREWCGFENLCMLMIQDPEFVHDMIDFWREFVLEVTRRVLDGVTIDSFHVSEDMAYKAHSMISPAMVREFLQPCYDAWIGLLRQRGVPLIDMDSDGYIAELIPIWIESGINVCDPIEVAAHNDIVAFRREFGRKMAYRGGIDKRAIAKGGDVIRAEIDRVVPPLFEEGGFIPSCDHGVPADISWPNFVDYARRLAGLCGWL
ncbi:MAG: uroporphyrinogen decarboxylase family protein [Planctomycetota bacterium]